MNAYFERLETFAGYWDADEATARQLAALGHAYDRPPLEAIEEGSRCLWCGKFVARRHSIEALDTGFASTREDEYDGLRVGAFTFHSPPCMRLQVRIPLERRKMSLDPQGGGKPRDVCARLVTLKTAVSTLPRQPQTASSFMRKLPTEIRLQIYAHVLPRLDRVTEIVPRDSRSYRVVTLKGFEKGALDPNKANLLQTCKLIHDEAIDPWYATTTFQFASTSVLYIFLRQLGARYRHLLQSVDVQCGLREDAVAFALLASCEKLRSLTIRLGRRRLLMSYPPLWMTDGMACLLSLSGLKKVSLATCSDGSRSNCMSDGVFDAEIIKGELVRPKGARVGFQQGIEIGIGQVQTTRNLSCGV